MGRQRGVSRDARPCRVVCGGRTAVRVGRHGCEVLRGALSAATKPSNLIARPRPASALFAAGQADEGQAEGGLDTPSKP